MSQIKDQILQIAESDPTYQQAIDQIEQALTGMDIEPDELEQAIKLFEFVLQNPDQYQDVMAFAVREDIIPEGMLPPEFNQTLIISLLVALYGLQNRSGSRGLASAAPAPQNFARGGLARAVDMVRDAGRNGDTELAHINPKEAQLLRAVGGSGTINPDTGFREYGFIKKLLGGKLGKILGAILPVALSIFAPGIGTAIGSALGASGTFASALGGAVIGGASAGLTGGNVLKGAAFGGLGGGLGSAVGGAADSALGLGLGQTGQSMLGSGLIGAGISAAQGKNPLKGALIGAAGGAAGSLGGQAGLGEAFTQGAQAFGNSVTVGNKLKDSAMAGGLAGLSSALMSPGQNAADQYKAGQDNAMYGKGAVEGTDIIPNDASGNTIGAQPQTGLPGQQPAQAGGGLGDALKYAPLVAAAGSLLGGAPEEAKQAVSQLSPSQQEYFNRPSVQWDWGKLQSEAQQSGLPLNQYISQRWDKVSSGAYNTPTVDMARGGLAAATGKFAQGGGSGRADTIAARLSDGEYVIDAETVAMLGDGSAKEGAKRLDAMRKEVRMHKGKKLSKGKISPDAKTPMQYIGANS